MSNIKIKKDKIILFTLSIFLVILLGYYAKAFVSVNQITFPFVKTNQVQAYPELTILKNKNPKNLDEAATFFQQLAKSKGAEYAYDVMRLAPLNPNIDQHLLGHYIGDILYKQQGADGIRICTPEFQNACSHSIVIGLFTQKGESAIPEIQQACEKVPGAGSYAQCFHGLGHGVVAWTEYDLPKALDICKKTSTKDKGGIEYVECSGGVVMEMVYGLGHDQQIWKQQRPKYLSSQDPLAPCDSSFMPSELHFICYTYLTPHLLEAAGDILADPHPEFFQKALAFCDNIPISDNSSRSGCFGGFGKDFAVLAHNRDIKDFSTMTKEQDITLYRWCTLASNRFGVQQCIKNALGSIFWGGANGTKPATDFCMNIPNNNFSSYCISELINNASSHLSVEDDKKGLCNSLPESFTQNCFKKMALGPADDTIITPNN